MEFPPPGYDVNVAVRNMLLSFVDGDRMVYGVGITNVDRTTLDWKYGQLYQYIVSFEKAIDERAAGEIKHMLVAEGFAPLENDPLGGSPCKNVFIRRLSATEVGERDNP